MNRRSLALWLAALSLLLVICGLAIAILVKVSKNNAASTPIPWSPTESLPFTSSRTSGASLLPGVSTPASSKVPSATTAVPPNLECMTKSSLPSAGDNSTFDPFAWGSFRGQLYFGMQTRHPQSPKFGIMWRKKAGDIRNWCDIDPNIRFMWLNSDGQTFGEQLITDNNFTFRTLWLNHQRSFSAKIVVDSLSDNETYQVWSYLALQDNSSAFASADFASDGSLTSAQGSFKPLQNNFTYTVSPNNADTTSFAIVADRPYVEMATVQDFLLAFQTADGQFDGTNFFPDANILAFQADFSDPDFALDISYQLTSDSSLPDFNETFENRKSQFLATFSNLFPIDQGDVAYKHLDMGREGLSNMLGSISYWHGYSNATGSCLSEGQTYSYGPLDLISGVPSRPGFPRGFLWDDGFHNLLIRQFNPDLSLQVTAWLDTMNTNGWIPREMFLTAEAAAKVPPGPWLIEQDDVANPPMLIYVVGKMLDDPEVLATYKDRLIQLFPRMRLLYTWLKTIQKGPIEGSFQWQGRDGTTNAQLNPQTLPSGLDDYPRATHSDNQEYHVDMLCWMAMSSNVMLKLAQLSNASDWLPEIQKDQALFNNLTNLDTLHWEDAAQGYFDYGLHSYQVRMVGAVRHVLEAPEYRHVDNVFGYVNIFPFLHRLLPPSSPKLGIILANISDPNCLWTDFGLRSVCKLLNGSPAPYYDAWNDANDAPYWRGPIWINMNYFALDALKYYSTMDGPYKARAGEIYANLRSNIVTNMGKVFEETGFIWEHYNDKNGKGEGTRPFTGWSALVLAIMADDYR